MPCEGMGKQYTHHGGKEWGGHTMRSPQGGLSTGKDRLKVVMWLRWGSDPASGHPGAQKRPLGRGPLPPWGVHLDAPGQQHCPPLCAPNMGTVKQGWSRGSIGKTYQGKGRVSREVRIGPAGRGRAQGGARPMGTAGYGGIGFKGRAAVCGERPMAPPAADSNATRCHAKPPPPPRKMQLAN